MEDKLKLYQAFIKFVKTLGEHSHLTKNELQKILGNSFYHHTDEEALLPMVKEITTNNENLDFLFGECIRICDELGPSREYFTFIHLFEDITREFSKKGTPELIELSDGYLQNFKKEIAILNQKIPHPPLFNMLLESRSLVEWTSIYAIYPFIPKRI